jgi:hypothetical protein
MCAVTTQLLFVFFIGASGEAAMSMVVQDQKQKATSGFSPRPASLPDWVTVGDIECVEPKKTKWHQKGDFRALWRRSAAQPRQ